VLEILLTHGPCPYCPWQAVMFSLRWESGWNPGWKPIDEVFTGKTPWEAVWKAIQHAA
jgi:hypothetical protein